MIKKICIGSSLFVLLLIAVYGFLYFYFVPVRIDQKNNFVHPTKSSGSATQEWIIPDWHKDLLIADLHADSLLWNRDLRQRSSYGHVDIPRMIQGNMGLQAFSIVTQVPSKISYDGNEKGSDSIFWLSVFQAWPFQSWFDLSARAFYQIDRFSQIIISSQNFYFIRTAVDLQTYIIQKQKNPQITAGWLAMEGAQSVEKNLQILDSYFQAGVRMISPAHLMDNHVGGSQQGTERYGLTDFGKSWLKKMDELGMIVDLAHASAATIDDVLQYSTRSPVVSHTGVKGTCDNNRNLTDEQLKKIAAKGGLIGIGFWDGATCGKTVEDIVKAIVYTKNLIGAEHVALGSDWDGFVATPFDVSQVGILTSALLAEGLSEKEIRLIMGENVFEFLLKNLP